MTVDLATTIAHVQKGHSNAQDVIKFLDTKSGAVTGLAVLTIGFSLAVVKWALEAERSKPSLLTDFLKEHSGVVTFAMIGMGCSVLVGVACVGMSLNSLMGRNPRRAYQGLFERIYRWWLKSQGRALVKGSEAITILFPIYREEVTENARKYFTRISSGLTEEEIRMEYELQLFEMGRILDLKIRWHRYAVSSLQTQMMAIVLTAIVALVLWRCGF